MRCAGPTVGIMITGTLLLFFVVVVLTGGSTCGVLLSSSEDSDEDADESAELDDTVAPGSDGLVVALSFACALLDPGASF